MWKEIFILHPELLLLPIFLGFILSMFIGFCMGYKCREKEELEEKSFEEKCAYEISRGS